jgi:hypothetical protein
VQGQSIRGGTVDVEYTAKALSGWGGLSLFYEFAEQIGFFERAEQLLPRKKVSPNQIASLDILKTLFATVLMGGNRFAHVERVRGDEVIRTLMGAKRVGGSDTTRRYFDELKPSENEDTYVAMQKFMSERLAGHVKADVLDLDSTILERYGRQEGVSKGYHTARAGQLSHHPLLGMLAQSKHIVHVWLRAGGASTMRGAKEFLSELFARLPAGLKITAVRADSGFHTEDFVSALEAQAVDYIVAVRMYPPMKRLAARTAKELWIRLDDEYEIADLRHQDPHWGRERRLLLARRRKVEKGSLFDTVSYEYSALVTSLDMTAPECVAFYDKRGECENTIKEFKNDFGADGFCMNSFHATEAVFRLLSVLFNLVTEFKRVVLRDCTTTLATVRVKVFVLGALLGRRARKIVLRLGLNHRWKESFDSLLRRATASLPTAAHLPLSP